MEAAFFFGGGLLFAFCFLPFSGDWAIYVKSRAKNRTRNCAQIAKKEKRSERRGAAH
jgi:hypothetical protein